jgi:ferredoxin--NADP+ reductase
VYRITAREDLTPVTRLVTIEAPEVARKAQPGQFVIVRANECGERVPLTIADFDRELGEITLVFQEVGKTTKLLGTMQVGDELASFTGPLGRPTEIEKYGTVLCVGGGVGIAPLYPIARALKAAGNTVISIIAARTENLLFWQDKMREVSHEFTDGALQGLIVCTDDGTCGIKALAPEPIKEILASGRRVDVAWAIGPAIMMKFCALATEPFGVKTIVSLNSIMVDGTGMCGACRVEVGGETRFVCVDGPEFDAHQVDWGLLLERQRFYLDQEKQALEIFEKQHAGHCGGGE